MKSFPGVVLFFHLLLCSTQTTSSSMREQKLTEYRAKLQEIIAPSSSPTSAPHYFKSKQNGRVFYPIGYGADPSGVEESSDAILNALNDAFQVQKGIDLLPGVNDLGGVIIELQGGNYKISKPIRFPPSGGGNVVVQGGTLRASGTFPGDRHLIEVWSTNSQPVDRFQNYTLHNDFNDQKDPSVRIYYEDITFRDILFDSGFRGGGLLVVDSARIRVTSCFFLHFTTGGISARRGHETYITTSFLGQHSTIGGDPGEKGFSGTAIDLASNDNAVTDVVIFSSAIGVQLSGQANVLTGVHCYNKATFWGGIGISVKLYASLTRIDNCYLDYNSIVMEDPVQVHVTNGLFLGGANIVVKSINGRISGVNILHNMFCNDPRNKNAIVHLDGEFSHIDQVVVDWNSVMNDGIILKSTIGKLAVVGKNATKWVADFNSVLLFPNRITHFQYSFYTQGVDGGGRFPLFAITNVSNNVVVVESDRAVNAVVSVIVDQGNVAGESNSVMQ